MQYCPFRFTTTFPNSKCFMVVQPNVVLFTSLLRCSFAFVGCWLLAVTSATIAQSQDLGESTYRSYNLPAGFLQPAGSSGTTITASQPVQPLQVNSTPIGQPVITSVVPLNGQAANVNLPTTAVVPVQPTPPSVRQIKAFNNPGYGANLNYPTQAVGYMAYQGGVVPAQFNGQFNPGSVPATNFPATTTPSTGPITGNSAIPGTLPQGSGAPYYNANPNAADKPPALGSTVTPQVYPSTGLGITSSAAPITGPCSPTTGYPGNYVQPVYTQPIVPQGSYRPIVSFSNGLPPGTYLGQGIIGQPKAYVDGQPVRNFFRYVFP
jgi:hypothetical protein